MDSGTPPLRVLVVDDDRDTADTVALLLEIGGHEAVVAYDGPSALSAALATLPDAAVLDIGLPGMNGCELARRLRALPGAAAMLLVALTGYADATHARACRAAGFDLYLVKPADSDELLAALEQAGHPALPAPA